VGVEEIVRKVIWSQGSVGVNKGGSFARNLYHGKCYWKTYV